MQRVNKKVKYSVFISLLFLLVLAASIVGLAIQNRSINSIALPTENWSAVADTSWFTTTGNYFEISTEEQFAGLAQIVNASTTTRNSMQGITIRLTNDLDLSSRIWTPIGRGGNIADAATNAARANFRGVFNGGGHTITMPKVINSVVVSNAAAVQHSAGLFGALWGEAATIENLVLDGTLHAINGLPAGVAFSYVGNLVGLLVSTSTSTQSATIRNVTNFANIEFNDQNLISVVSGVVGGIFAPSQFVNVANYGNITARISQTGSSLQGGIGNFNGAVGGILGWMMSATQGTTTITNVYNRGNLTRTGATTNVVNTVGGIIGYFNANAKTFNFIASYNYGVLTHPNNATGEVIGGFTTNAGTRAVNANAVFGRSGQSLLGAGTITRNIANSGLINSEGNIVALEGAASSPAVSVGLPMSGALNRAQDDIPVSLMVEARAFKAPGLDGHPSMPSLSHGLTWQSTDMDFSGNDSSAWGNGTGSLASPFLISTPEQLARLAYRVNGGRLTSNNSGEDFSGQHFRVTTDIDLSEREWVPIGLDQDTGGAVTGSHVFRGNFDGGYNTITLPTALRSPRSNQATMRFFGFFGMAVDATFRNIILDSNGAIDTLMADIPHSLSMASVGTLVGMAESVSVTNVISRVDYNLDTVRFVGGIIGASRYVNFTNVANYGDITTINQNHGLGGVTGWIGISDITDIPTNIINAYNRGKISTAASTTNFGVGGIVGTMAERADFSVVVNLRNVYSTPAPSAPSPNGRIVGFISNLGNPLSSNLTSVFEGINSGDTYGMRGGGRNFDQVAVLAGFYNNTGGLTSWRDANSPLEDRRDTLLEQLNHGRTLTGMPTSSMAVWVPSTGDYPWLPTFDWTQEFFVQFNHERALPEIAYQAVRGGHTATAPTGTPIDTAQGERITGWSLVSEASGNTQTVFNFATTTISEHTTLYAIWSPITFSVSFDHNRPGVPLQTIHSVGWFETIESRLPTVAPRAGFSFTHWSRNNASFDTTLSFGSLSDWGTVTSFSFRAEWFQHSFSVSFNTLGGSLATQPAVQSVAFNGQASVPSVIPIWDGAGERDFLHWSTSPNGGNFFNIPAPSRAIISDTVLYAVWSGDPIPIREVTFRVEHIDLENGFLEQTVSQAVGTPFFEPNLPPLPTGVVVVAWVNDANQTVSFPITPTLNTTLTAVLAGNTAAGDILPPPIWNLSATDTDTLSFVWNAVLGASSYAVYLNGWRVINTISATSLNLALYNLAAGTYNIQIRALHSSNPGYNSLLSTGIVFTITDDLTGGTDLDDDPNPQPNPEFTVSVTITIGTEVTDQTISVAVGQTASLDLSSISVSVPDGYIFMGWATAPAGAVVHAVDAALSWTTAATVRLYAVFESEIPPDPVVLNAPTELEVNDGILSWQGEGDSFGIYVDGERKATADTNSFDLRLLELYFGDGGEFSISVRALGDGTLYLDSVLSQSIRVYVEVDDDDELNFTIITTDKAALIALSNQVSTHLESYRENYTEESLAALEAALAAAAEVLGNPLSTQSEIDAAYEELAAAFAALEEQGGFFRWHGWVPMLTFNPFNNFWPWLFYGGILLLLLLIIIIAVAVSKKKKRSTVDDGELDACRSKARDAINQAFSELRQAGELVSACDAAPNPALEQEAMMQLSKTDAAMANAENCVAEFLRVKKTDKKKAK